MLKKNKGLALSSSKGFTLIELLVVIAIIGILSSVVITSLNSTREKARDSRRQTDMRNIQLAAIAWSDDQVSFSYNFCTGGTAMPADGESLEDYFPSGPPITPSGAAYTCFSTLNDFCISAPLERTVGLLDTFSCDEDECQKTENVCSTNTPVQDVTNL